MEGTAKSQPSSAKIAPVGTLMSRGVLSLDELAGSPGNCVFTRYEKNTNDAYIGTGLLLKREHLHKWTDRKNYPSTPMDGTCRKYRKEIVIKCSCDHSSFPWLPGRGLGSYYHEPSTARSSGCVICQPGMHSMESPRVFEISSTREIHVTIGRLLCNRACHRPPNTGSALDRLNRSFEYDGLGQLCADYTR